MKLIKYFFALLLFSRITYAMEEDNRRTLKFKNSEEIEKKACLLLEKLPMELIEYIGFLLLTTNDNEVNAIKDHLNFAHVIKAENKEFRPEMRLGGPGKSKEEYQVEYIKFFVKHRNVNAFILIAKLKIKLSVQAKEQFKNLMIEKELEKQEINPERLEKKLSDFNQYLALHPQINYHDLLLAIIIHENHIFLLEVPNDSIVCLLALLKVVNPDGKNENGFMALESAVCWGKKEMVQILLAVGADPNILDKDGKGFLIKALYSVYLEKDIIGLLIKFGADLNRQDKTGCTALMSSIAQIFFDGKYKEIVQMLLDAGADCNLKDEKGNTALDYAIKFDNFELVELLKTYKVK